MSRANQAVRARAWVKHARSAAAASLTCLLALLLGLTVTLASAAEPVAGARLLRSTDVHTEDFPTVQAVMFMGQTLAEKTHDKLRIQVFHSGLLGDEGPLLELVKAGKLDMTRVSAQALDPVAPLLRVLCLPYLFRDINHLHKVLDGPIGNEILESLGAQGLIGLAYYDAGIRNVYSTERPVKKLEDLKGMRIRVQPSALASETFEALKAHAVPLPFSQAGRALKNGIVDAAENNTPSYSSEGHYKIAPYYSLTGHSMAPDILVMSRQTWDKLTHAEQELVRSAARESVTMMRDMWAQREERVEASLKLAGIRFGDISAAERARFAAAVEPVYARFAAEPRQQDLIKRIRALQ